MQITTIDLDIAEDVFQIHGIDFAARIGLVPWQDSTGGKQKLGPISKQGDRYLRRLLVVGAHAVIRKPRRKLPIWYWRNSPAEQDRDKTGEGQ
jgi:transposase